MDTKRNLYENSKIYKIIDTVNDYFYIGSTTQRLSKRLSGHKEKAKKFPERQVYRYFNSVSWENVKILLVSEHQLRRAT